MRRFRHPIRAIREPFGTAGLIVASIALIAALGGTAFAAAKLNSTQKKEVEKIAKKFAGKPGTNGTNGSNGAPGAKGDSGSPGAAGTPGANGKSVETGNATVGECPAGGATVQVVGEVATKKKICNGNPVEFPATLPSGKTEMGSWSAIAIEGTNDSYPLGTISYSIPLAAPSGTVKFLNKEETELSVGSGGCELDVTNAAAKPIAPKDTLCVFTRAPEENGTFTTISPRGQLVSQKGDSPAGTLIWFEPEEIEPGRGVVKFYGTWAVTAK